MIFIVLYYCELYSYYGIVVYDSYSVLFLCMIAYCIVVYESHISIVIVIYDIHSIVLLCTIVISHSIVLLCRIVIALYFCVYCQAQPKLQLKLSWAEFSIILK